MIHCQICDKNMGIVRNDAAILVGLGGEVVCSKECQKKFDNGQHTSPVVARLNLQETFLQIIKENRFNAFYGEDVYNVLNDHRDKWDAVALYPIDVGLLLRDLPTNLYKASHLYILCHEEHAKFWLLRMKQWRSASCKIHSKRESRSLLGIGNKECNQRIVFGWFD